MREMAKYRLVPDPNGTYTLEKWYGPGYGYMDEECKITPEQADKYLKNIERDIMYYRGRKMSKA